MSGFKLRFLIAAAAASVAVFAALAARAEDETPAAPKPTAQERVKQLQGVLEQMRGKKFKHDVGVETQSLEDFRKFVDKELDKELPPDKAKAVSKTLQAFELLPKGYDLRKGLSDLYVSQAGAYYNPDTRKFYMLMTSMPDNQLDAMILHELMHALQDQYFELKPAMTKIAAAGNEDATAAFQFLVEGEATYLMTLYQLKGQGIADPAALGPMEEIMFARMRDMDRAMLAANSDMLVGMLGPESADLKRALEALKTMPGYLFWSLHAPYLSGQYAAYKLRRAGKGYEKVDALFAADGYPASTEQMLHPAKLAGGAAPDAPAAVALDGAALQAALGKDWAPQHANVMGELGVFILMDEKLPAEPQDPMAAMKPGAQTRRAKVAAGWDGDRYLAFEGPGGALALVWKTAWDGEADAKEFADTLAEFGWKDATVRGTEVVVLKGVPEAVRAKVLAAAGAAGGGTGVR